MSGTKECSRKNFPSYFEGGKRNKKLTNAERVEDLWGPGVGYLSGITSFGSIFVTHTPVLCDTNWPVFPV